MRLTEVLALGIVRRGDEIAMVQQADESGPYWVLPGGLVEPGELAGAALAREVAEEAGLAISGQHALAYVSQIDRPNHDSQVIAFVFEVGAWSGTPAVCDPDGEVLAVALVPLAEALGRIGTNPWRGMREPLQAYLRGEARAGGLWCYREFADERDQRLIERIGG